MSTLNDTKKTAEDWHRADIIAALHKKAGRLDNSPYNTVTAKEAP